MTQLINQMVQHGNDIENLGNIHATIMQMI